MLGLLAIALVVLVRGVRQGVTGNRMIGIGILILSGLLLGLIPTVIGNPNNRYYVVPALLWGTALLVSLDPWFRRTRAWVLALIVAVTLVIWWPAMAASSFRATPAPSWIDEAARVKAACSAAPDAQEILIFSPSWPPNQGEGFTEPTHPRLPCVLVWRWL